MYYTKEILHSFTHLDVPLMRIHVYIPIFSDRIMCIINFQRRLINMHVFFIRIQEVESRCHAVVLCHNIVQKKFAYIMVY